MKSAASRTPPLFKSEPAQLALPLGFWTEPQKPITEGYIHAPRPAPVAPCSLCVRHQEWRPFLDGRDWYCHPCGRFGHTAEQAAGKPEKTAAAKASRKRGSESPPQPSPPPTAASRSDAAEAIEVRLEGMRLVNPLNGSQGTTRGAMIAASRRRKEQRARARLHVSQRSVPAWGAFRVTITRVAPGKFDIGNLWASVKAVQDGIADALGFRDDSAPGLDWHVAQEPSSRARMASAKGPAMMAVYAVVIKIESGAARAATVPAKGRAKKSK